MGNARVRSIHVHPVKAFRSLPLREVVVERWGPAGDRRWMLIDDGGKVVTQRRHPRLALAAAELLPGGGVVLSAPGRDPVTVPVPAPGATVPADVFGDKVEAVPAEDAAVHAWCGDFLGTPVRLVHLDDPAVRRPVDPAYALPGETVTFADGYPLLLTTTASLDRLNSLVAQGEHAHEGPLPMSRFRPNVVIEGTEPRTAGPASPSARWRSGSPRPADGVWSPPPTRTPPAADANPCTPWAGTGPSAAGSSSA